MRPLCLSRLLRMAAWLVLALLSGPLVAETWRVGVDQGFREDRLGIGFGAQEVRSEFLAKDLPGLDTPQLKGGQRTLLEILLIGVVLRSIDPEARIVLVPFSNVRRALVMLLAQEIDVIGQTLSDSDVSLNLERAHLKQSMLRSPPLIRRNEFELGVFTTANRHDILRITDALAFRSLRGVTVASWAGDMALMQRIVNQNIVTVPRRDMLAAAITNTRGDFTFSFLSEAVVTRIGGELVRIPGFKVSVPDERAFYMALRRPALREAFEALFDQLRARKPDALATALAVAGTFAPEYRDWVDLARLPE